jgi:hypothetical protein
VRTSFDLENEQLWKSMGNVAQMLPPQVKFHLKLLPNTIDDVSMKYLTL